MAGDGTAEAPRNLNEFESDTHRRVVANLSVPRSVGELADHLRQHDPYVSAEAYGEGSLMEYLKDLEADGLVKNIGTYPDGAEAVKAVRGDGGLIDFPGPKAAAFCARAERPDVGPFLDEEQWVMTQLALDKINGPVPGEPPPLKGAALKHAERLNAELAAADRERVRKSLRAEAKRLRERAQDLEGEAKKL